TVSLKAVSVRPAPAVRAGRRTRRRPDSSCGGDWRSAGRAHQLPERSPLSVASSAPAMHDWPELPLTGWADTYATLHRWTQIVGKTRLRLAPMQNHWWNVTLYLTSRGLTTSPMPAGPRELEIDFDFIDHRLSARTSDGRMLMMPLRAQTVAEFY